jgi:CrcB protein
VYNFLAVGLGGALGAVLRHAITILMVSMAPGFPFGTLVSNVIAGFFCGGVVHISTNSNVMHPTVGIFLATGCMCGLSTFSAFSVATIELFKQSKYMLGSVNIMANLVLSLLFAFLGMVVAKKLI